jgi:hypothetical protein
MIDDRLNLVSCHALLHLGPINPSFTGEISVILPCGPVSMHRVIIRKLHSQSIIAPAPSGL